MTILITTTSSRITGDYKVVKEAGVHTFGEVSNRVYTKPSTTMRAARSAARISFPCSACAASALCHMGDIGCIPDG